MKCKLIAIAAMIALLTGCAAGTAQISKPVTQEAQAKRDQMVGRWYGKRPIENGTFEWIVERHDDGTYLVHFRYPDSDSGEDVEQREVGLWGVSGDIYFTITRGWVYGDRISPGDPANANLYDAYVILEFEKDRMKYRSPEVDREYEIRRVSRDFTFPD